MTPTASYEEQDGPARLRQVLPGLALVGAGGACLTIGVLLPGHSAAPALFAAAGAFLALGVLMGLRRLLAVRRAGRAFATLRRLAEADPAPALIEAADGRLLFANDAALAAFGTGETLADRLGVVLPDADMMMQRLRLLAGARGASEDVATPAGRHRVTVISAGELSCWRIERLPTGSTGPTAETVAVAEAQNAAGDAPVLTVGRSGAVLYMNAAARTLLGRRVKRLDEVLETPPRSGKVQQIVTPSGVRNVQIRCSDAGVGRQEVVLHPMPEQDPQPAGVRDGVDELPVPLLRLAPDGRILRANAEACRMLEVQSADGSTVDEHMEGLGRSITDWLADAAVGRGLHRSEFLRLVRPEREVFVQVTLNCVIQAGQAELVAVLNDATELKSLEAQFVQSQKMQAIGQLAGGVAHDFNNLLTAISGHCDLLLLRHDQGDADYADLMQINQNANRAASLVGQLLAFSRKQTLSVEMLDLRDTLSDLTHLLNRLVGERVHLTLRHDPVLPPIRGDRRQLEQVMMNLVVNARDAMPEGGEIVIESERCVVHEPLLRDRAKVEPGAYACVKVIDQGSGIPQDKLQKVFEPFFTTKRTGEGTGLGLSTVYGIVKQTGGFIFIDSVPGEGSCFTLLFPAYEEIAEPELAPAEAAPAAAARDGSVVLVVEDEAPVRAFATRALRLRGFTVIEAETAEQALEVLEDETLKVDVFVTDVVMPGLDGPSWVRRALEKRPGTRVVFVSGYAEESLDKSRVAVPNSVFLPKPFSLSELTETVRQQLG
ncbi:hybrid sensor histidine kinase/response regulator [Alloyangia pacifica]|uniref:histidine kinase n=1 Tax=Alloyangia pacifica TaxID=311180 RepID=A0A1I6PVW8_9RHOB|nr:ATP-binding protein [Alloyangia pacifica]SDG36582.1 two-component system, cell cycle sensor histidine kinase and response regulator CckA [Alloyangia pacifica]SFS44228.1 two-component system, cell cycle sensor histidine kinase and response regulator CckA [Alloyangia pacifica]